MDIGLKHLFYAFTVAWVIHLVYLLRLSLRQKRLSREMDDLRKHMDSKAGNDQ